MSASRREQLIVIEATAATEDVLNSPFGRLDFNVLLEIVEDRARVKADRENSQAEIDRRENLNVDDLWDLELRTLDVEESTPGYCHACGSRGDGLLLACRHPERKGRHEVYVRRETAAEGGGS